MRAIPVTLALLCLWLTAVGQEQDNPARFKIELNTRKYPQAKPEEAMASVVLAVNQGNFDYLMAHLADPAYVDAKVAEYKKLYARGTDAEKELVAFDFLAGQIRDHFRKTPSLVQDLRRIAREAQWEVGEDRAVASLPGSAEKASFVKLGERWFLLNQRE